MLPKNTTKIDIYLSKSLKKEIEKKSKRHKLSLSKYVVEIIKKDLKPLKVIV